MRNRSAHSIALSGIMAALAITIMCLGGLIPVATYICPLICSVICFIILQKCGKRIALVWYVTVSLLSLLIGPDKEAAAVFLFLGYYPIVKQSLDIKKFHWLWKFLLFNTAVGVLYLFQLYILGIDISENELHGFGQLWLVLLLILGNFTFFLTDKLLNKLLRKC